MGFDPVTAAIGAVVSLAASDGDLESALLGGALGGFGGGLFGGAEGALGGEAAAGALGADFGAFGSTAADLMGSGIMGAAPMASSIGADALFSALPEMSGGFADSLFSHIPEALSQSQILGPMSFAPAEMSAALPGWIPVDTAMPALVESSGWQPGSIWEDLQTGFGTVKNVAKDVQQSPLYKAANYAKKGYDYLENQDANQRLQNQQRSLLDRQLAAYAQQGQQQPAFSNWQPFGVRNRRMN